MFYRDVCFVDVVVVVGGMMEEVDLVVVNFVCLLEDGE